MMISPMTISSSLSSKKVEEAIQSDTSSDANPLMCDNPLEELSLDDDHCPRRYESRRRRQASIW